MNINIENIVSLTEFRKDVYGIVDQVVETDTPEILTRQGEAVAVVISAKSFQRLSELADEALFNQHKQTIEQALTQLKKGETIDASAAYQALSEKYGLPIEKQS